MKVPVPLVEIVKFPTFERQHGKTLGFEATGNQRLAPDMEEDTPNILSSSFGKTICMGHSSYPCR